MRVRVFVCSVRACVLHRHIDIYIIELSRQSLGVNVDVALPSVGSVVPWNMTHAITGRRGTLYQLLAIATTRGGTRCEIQRVSPHIHTASNNINRQIEIPYLSSDYWIIDNSNYFYLFFISNYCCSSAKTKDGYHIYFYLLVHFSFLILLYIAIKII